MLESGDEVGLVGDDHRGYLSAAALAVRLPLVRETRPQRGWLESLPVRIDRSGSVNPTTGPVPVDNMR